ncbi:MAG: low-specificity L-threonine aldolase [Bacteroidetes bacterium MED-G20]|nr:MAG: low-specificity L-threonine aldolase [Bacteroidetes bacterium MED-G20]
MIDLRSDTVTKPSKFMKKYMMDAALGDDVFQDDPTVKELENKTARMFGHEAGLFCSSGTMTNQIALMVYLRPGDEVICSSEAHIYNYEGGGIARNSGASARLINRNSGIVYLDEIIDNINPDDIHYPVTNLVALENTINRGGGICYPISEIEKISKFCESKNIPLHLDGARLFNALVKTGVKTNYIGPLFDSISICFSKGLGAPVGSVLVGSKEFIRKARRVRKVIGGGMRQVGMLAAAGIYALENNIERLAEDHQHANLLAEGLRSCSWIDKVMEVETNIVIGYMNEGFQNSNFVEKLQKLGVSIVSFGKGRIRMVTHLDVSKQDIDKVISLLKF